MGRRPWIGAIAIGLAACSGAASANPVTGDEVTTEVLGATVPSSSSVPATTAPAAVTTTSTAAPRTTATAEVTCPAEADEVRAPTEVVERLETAADHEAFADVELSVSVWIDGWGEVLTVGPDLLLAPASNQKLLVAIAANELLDPNTRLATTFEHRGGDLVLRAGGDPTLTTTDIDALSAQVAAHATAFDRLIIDVSDHPQPPRASGWLDWQIPTYVGPLSGLMLDDNRWTTADAFVAAPALGNGQRIAERLRAAGVDIGAAELGAAPPGEVIAEHESPPIGELVTWMLHSSDNQHADLLMMELGRAMADSGTLAAGADAIDAVIGSACTPLQGVSDDGSGLSRTNRRSAHEFQRILRTLDDDARNLLISQLPTSGYSGTMQHRLTSDRWRVAAKTGTIIGGRALSGYTTTDSGRDVVFSIIVNGEPDPAARALFPIDELVFAILRIDE